MVKSLKLIEYFAIFVIILSFSLATGKYYYPHFKKYMAVNNKKNESKEIYKRNEKIETIDMVNNFNLRRNDKNGQWELLEENGDKSQQFILAKNTDGKIIINRKSGSSLEKIIMKANFKDLRTYHSQQNGPIETEIPFEKSEDDLILAEQEDVIPIMGYHFIIPDGQEIKYENLEMTQSDFRRQVKFMTEEMGCRWFTFQEIMDEYILVDKKTPQNACVMNFDDGRRNSYTQAFPVLQEFGVRATFYIITDRIDSSDKYMTWEQVDELYRNGNEMGSHTLSSGDLVDDWEKNGKNREEKLKKQLEDSLKILKERGYKTTTFAYPRGRWNEEVVKAVQEAGYSAARDIRKKDTWRDKRTLTIGMDDNFIWHMHYIHPEGMNNEQLQKTLSYDGWWQFEEGMQTAMDISADSSEIEILSSVHPTDRSHASLRLHAGQGVSNRFRVGQTGTYDVEFLGALSKELNNKKTEIQNAIEVYIDGIRRDVNINLTSGCTRYNSWQYCLRGARVNLTAGIHTITIKAVANQIFLDKFKVTRSLPLVNSYDVEITETKRIKK